MNRHDTRDLRVLVLAPRGRDASVVSQVLQAHELQAVHCNTLTELVDGIAAGAGLAFVTEESLVGSALQRLTALLAQQPPWSDFPVVVLATRQAGRRTVQAMVTLKGLGNVVLLERPLNTETLVSAARSALRSRTRQYQTRSHLEDQDRTGRDNERLHEAERQALREAAEMRQTLSLAVDAAELGTFHCPMPLGPVVLNEIGRRHYGLPRDAVLDHERLLALIHPDDRVRAREAIAAAITHGLPYDIEYRSVTPSGRLRWLGAKGRAFYDARGKVSRFDGVTIDISRQKDMQADRERLLVAERAAREGAERASRAKDEFLATLSHELRTPLSVILGWVHLLRKRPGEGPELTKGIDTIERNARAQSRLIDELLDMSRIIAGNVHLDLQPVMPSVVVDAVLASLQPDLDAKGIEIHRDIDATIGPVPADGHRLQQVVGNLLSNAIKFTPTGGQIRVELSSSPGAVRLVVTDSGEGIAPDFLPFVFDRFRQADGSSTRKHGGLGLGLAIVRQLVELHGGEVQADSAGIARGACFTVSLPLNREPAGHATDAVPAPSGGSMAVADGMVHGSVDNGSVVGVAGDPAAMPELHGLRLVLVDDDADGREVIARVLADRGATVCTADSAEAAVRVLADGALPDVLISDIGMPLVDGYQLLRRVRQLGYIMPAIALTAFARPEERGRAMEAGYTLHMAKPVEVQDLVASIARLAQADSVSLTARPSAPQALQRSPSSTTAEPKRSAA